ncbi:MAG: hypothetical protein HRU70_02990 [Phycisphaeraceae bacterium]|nr:MAG: hypothetical protein HRU70_02990 [Phycisphaeraceae bacterium]
MNPLMQYLNILHDHGGPNSQQAAAFRKEHEADPVLLKRIKAVDLGYRLSHPSENGCETPGPVPAGQNR